MMSLNVVGFDLVSDQGCDKAFYFILSVVVCTVKFGGDSTFWYNKKHDNEFPLNGLQESLLGSKIEMIPVHISTDIIRRIYFGGSCRKNKICLSDITSHARAHSQ